MDNALSERQVNLLSLVPKNSIDEAIRLRSLEGFEKIDQLGEGHFGSVYKYAIKTNFGTQVAAGKHLKVRKWNLSEAQVTDLKNRIKTFIEELNILHRVSSECKEHFVQFIGCYLDKKKLILFIEFMPNGSIKDHIVCNQPPLKEATALKYTFQATQGLNFLHHYKGGRIVHRDIKCANLLLTSEYNVKLADFGLAYNLAVDNDSYTVSQGAPCGIVGTAIFAAPEVLVETKYGRRADIWSLGCTLVEMLTCQPPHADFWLQHKERAQFLFLEQARAEPAHQLQYTGHQLVPHASVPVQKLLDCLFIKDKMHRPRSEDVLGIFSCVSSSPVQVTINSVKLDEMQQKIQTAYNNEMR